MPSIEIPLKSGGPLVDIDVSVPKNYAPWGGPPGVWRALIDTGSTVTTISPAIVAALQPMRLGAQAVRRPFGRVEWCDTYDVRIRFGRARGKWFPTEALEVQPAAPGVDVLIGMDLLLSMTFTWDGPRGVAASSL